jgi:mRNA interferase MazF
VIFEQGDVIWMDFDPTVGHEPQKRRPALVVSSRNYNLLSNLTIVCPITSTDNGFPLHEEIPEMSDVKGFIAMEQLRAVDLTVREASKAGQLGKKDMVPILTCLKSFFEI